LLLRDCDQPAPFVSPAEGVADGPLAIAPLVVENRSGPLIRELPLERGQHAAIVTVL
jgi:hypothetical protein